MNEFVPDFQVDGDDYPISTSSALHRPNKSSMAEEEIMELLWQNGQVIMQSQTHTQKPLKKFEQSPPIPDEAPPPPQQLFMQEDEMASWLQYPMEDSSFDRDLYSDLFYPPPPCTPVTTAPAPIPPPGPSLCPSVQPDRRERGGNFFHFSRGKVARDPAVVGSSVTAIAAGVLGGNVGRCVEQVGTSTAGGNERETEMSSPVGSGGSICASAERLQFPAKAREDRKRKGVEVEVDGEEAECQSEDIEFESPDAKKQTRRSTSTKRSRAAEVHNLSERRRRDRINEKMKALQELIPRCNKSDKASMLDEAIEYLKSLQMQVQMMSMGCGMVPMMFPGMQPYMSPMGMGMGMGMEMGMNRPMMPFLPMMSGSALPNSAATGHMGPRFPMPAFRMQSVPLPNPSETRATNQSESMINLRTQNLNQPHMPFFSDPYQQYLRLQQVPLHQNQIMTQPQPSTSKPSSCREAGNRLDPKSG